jgi:hypothetical protein
MSLRAEHGSRLKECLALCSSKVRKCSTSRAFVIYLYGISLSYSICLISNPALSVMGFDRKSMTIGYLFAFLSLLDRLLKKELQRL